MSIDTFRIKKYIPCSDFDAVINYIEKRSSCLMAALDAEQAFDKIWRDGLFYKLMTKMSYPSYLLNVHGHL
jgi:hypothetical protein